MAKIVKIKIAEITTIKNPAKLKRFLETKVNIFSCFLHLTYLVR